jgi:hypothetical protein
VGTSISQQLSNICPGATYNFSLYAGMYAGISSYYNEFSVTLGGAVIIPSQNPCPGPDTCLIRPYLRFTCFGYFYNFFSVAVTPTTTSPVLEIAATFNVPPGQTGQNPAGILIDMVQMVVI